MKEQPTLATAAGALLRSPDLTPVQRVRLLDLKFRLESDARTLERLAPTELTLVDQIAAAARRPGSLTSQLSWSHVPVADGGR